MKPENIERATTWAGYAWLAVVGFAVVAMSWTGLVGFGIDNLGLSEERARLVPLSLDGIAVTLAFFGLRSTLRGDSAVFPRVLAWIVVAGGAAANYYHARSIGQGGAAELFFAGMTVLVYLTFEVVLRQLRRRQLHDRGAIEGPLPRFRLARWLRFPRLTFKAWSAAVRFGLTDPADALERIDVQRSDSRIQVDPQAVFEQSREFIEALEVKETTTSRRTLTARNGTQSARIEELYGQGLDMAAIIATTGFKADTVRITLRRIEERKAGS